MYVCVYIYIYIYIYMFQKRKNETGVQRNGLLPTRDKCRLTFRQEFEARFIGRDIKVLATGLDSLFQNTIYILYLFDIASRFSKINRVFLDKFPFKIDRNFLKLINFRSKLWMELLFIVIVIFWRILTFNGR